MFFFLVSDCDNTTELQTEMEGNQNVSERKHRLVQGGDKHQSWEYPGDHVTRDKWGAEDTNVLD